MYTNTGEKIIAVANVMAILGVILSFIVALLVGTFVSDLTYEEVIGFIVGIIVFAFGCVSSYLSYLLLAGYGELIENTQKSAMESERIKIHLKAIYELSNPTKKGKEKKEATASTTRIIKQVVCGNCGYAEEYEGLCPKCNSSIKLYKNITIDN